MLRTTTTVTPDQSQPTDLADLIASSTSIIDLQAPPDELATPASTVVPATVDVAVAPVPTKGWWGSLTEWWYGPAQTVAPAPNTDMGEDSLSAPEAGVQSADASRAAEMVNHAGETVSMATVARPVITATEAELSSGLVGVSKVSFNPGPDKVNALTRPASSSYQAMNKAMGKGATRAATDNQEIPEEPAEYLEKADRRRYLELQRNIRREELAKKQPISFKLKTEKPNPSRVKKSAQQAQQHSNQGRIKSEKAITINQTATPKWPR